MNDQLLNTQSVPFVIMELDANGNQVSANPTDTVSISSSDPSITVMPDAEPTVAGALATGSLVATSGATATGVQIISQAQDANGNPIGQPFTLLIDVVNAPAAGAVSITMTLGAPFNTPTAATAQSRVTVLPGKPVSAPHVSTMRGAPGPRK